MPEPSPEQINRMRLADHDVIVGLDVKVTRLISDVSDMSKNIDGRLASAESKIEAIEKYHAAIDMPRYSKLADSYENFSSNWKIMISIAIFISGVMASIITAFIIKTFHI